MYAPIIDARQYQNTIIFKNILSCKDKKSFPMELELKT